MGYFNIFGTIAFTVYGQLVLKWRIEDYGKMPADFFEKIFFLTRLLFDPFIFSGFVAAFVASYFWMATMTQFDLSFAYPFMSLSFVFVLFFAYFLFNEPLSFEKIVGMALIVAGIIVSSRSV